MFSFINNHKTIYSYTISVYIFQSLRVYCSYKMEIFYRSFNIILFQENKHHF